MFLLSTKVCEASKTNSADPDQTAPVGAVWSGSTKFAAMLMLNRHFQMQLLCWRLRTKQCVLRLYWDNGASWYSYFWIKPRLIFSFYLYLMLTSPNYAFMRRRLYSKRKVKEYNSERIVGWNWTRRLKYLWLYRCVDKWYFLWTPILVRFKTINKDNCYFLRTLSYLLTWVPYHLKLLKFW